LARLANGTFFGNLDACGGLDDFCGLDDFSVLSGNQRIPWLVLQTSNG
jgi:hypothetical protein